jgi:hypothetical protein
MPPASTQLEDKSLRMKRESGPRTIRLAARTWATRTRATRTLGAARAPGAAMRAPALAARFTG